MATSPATASPPRKASTPALMAIASPACLTLSMLKSSCFAALAAFSLACLFSSISFVFSSARFLFSFSSWAILSVWLFCGGCCTFGGGCCTFGGGCCTFGGGCGFVSLMGDLSAPATPLPPGDMGRTGGGPGGVQFCAWAIEAKYNIANATPRNKKMRFIGTTSLPKEPDSSAPPCYMYRFDSGSKEQSCQGTHATSHQTKCLSPPRGQVASIHRNS